MSTLPSRAAGPAARPSRRPSSRPSAASRGRPELTRKWKVLGWLSIALAAVAVIASLSVYSEYLRLNGNISHVDLNKAIGGNRPKKLNNAVNILLMGSDSRAGTGGKYGHDVEGARSDTLMLLHISPGGGQTLGISFPRDLMVPIPACGDHPAQTVNMINSAFTEGGPACTLHTVETLTNIKIDHFMDINFVGFKNVVTALHGVRICLPKAVNDKDSGLDLSAGYHTVTGEQALAYVRNRHGLGDGSDLDRVKRQQQFLGSVAKKALSAGTIGNPSKLLPLLNSATKSLTTDTGFDVNAMMSLAGKLKGLTAGKIRFVTAPLTAYVPDPNRVAFAQPAANDLFSEIRLDKKLPAAAKTATASAAPKATVPAAQVKIRVFNTSGVTGKAATVAQQLTADGFTVVSTGNSPTGKTKILYGKGAAAAANTLAAKVGGVTPAVHTGGAGSPGVVDLYVGADYPAQASGALPPSLSGEITATGNICQN